MLPGADAPVAPTHWSFGQLASLVGAPAAYLRQLPAPLAGINLQYGLTSHRAEQVKTLEIEDGRVELRAVTGPDYGRIFDHELVEAVQRIAGNGTGDTRWKVPGVLDWSTGRLQSARRHHEGHDDALCLRPRRLPVPGRRPQPDRGRPAAGRLARSLLPRLLLLELRGRRQDARHRELLSPRGLPEPQSLGRRGFRGDHHPPLQICRLPLRARGGAGADPLRQFLAHAVRQRHQGGARADRRPHRRGPHRLPAQARLLARPRPAKIIETVLAEEGRQPESVFDFVQGITAVARDKPHQDARLDLEGKAKKLLDRAA